LFALVIVPNAPFLSATSSNKSLHKHVLSVLQVPIENGFGLVIKIQKLFMLKVLLDSKICKKILDNAFLKKMPKWLIV
jgi:hypothetical protein